MTEVDFRGYKMELYTDFLKQLRPECQKSFEPPKPSEYQKALSNALAISLVCRSVCSVKGCVPFSFNIKDNSLYQKAEKD